MKLFNPAKKHEYVLLADRKNPKPTVFEFRRLTRDEMFDYAARSALTLEQCTRAAQINQTVKRERRALKKDEIAFMKSLEPKTFEDVKRVSAAYAFAVERGLTAIRGLLDEKGKPLTMTPDAFVEIAPAEIVHELGEFALAISALNEADTKN